MNYQPAKMSFGVDSLNRCECNLMLLYFESFDCGAIDMISNGDAESTIESMIFELSPSIRNPMTCDGKTNFFLVESNSFLINRFPLNKLLTSLDAR